MVGAEGIYIGFWFDVELFWIFIEIQLDEIHGMVTTDQTWRKLGCHHQKSGFALW